MLILHRSERADQLLAALGGVLSAPLDDPIVAEVVSVPTRGVERWITQRLSHRLGAPRAGGGVCANLDFPFPGVLVGRATAQATGVDPDTDPWAPDRAVWPLIDIIDGHSSDGCLQPLLDHLRATTPADRAGGETQPRRFAVARHIADLFDRYGVHRPEMVRSWAAAIDDGGWQPHLWRLLRDRLGVASPAERLPGAVEAISATPGLLDLPPRLSVFGLTRLPAGQLQVLAALGAGRDVHLYLLHPSGGLWERAAALLPTDVGLVDRGDDPTQRIPRSPLLRSWGRDAREMQVVLAAHGITGGTHYPAAEATEGDDGKSRSLLRRLQDDIRADRAPSESTGSMDPVEGRDDSVRVYSCHGRARQVEVLRDAILHLLQDDATIEPRDVIVMCPDIESFAPLIQATFGTGTDSAQGWGDRGPFPALPDGASLIRVRLADRSLRQTNPLLGVAGLLLDLAGSRVTASAVLDLASRPAVSRRFGFDRDDLASIERWVADVGVHWGFDAEHRGRWDLSRFADNTWASGLDRLLLGVAMADDGCRLFADTVPYGDLPSSTVDLAGRMTELVQRLQRAVKLLQGPQPLTAWAESLVGATESLASAPDDEPWQPDQLRRTLGEAVEDASGPYGSVDLTLEEARSLLAGRLAGRPTRANFRTGDLTFCTLVPMRSVPHRVVALLGLDDGTFPRHPEPDGDDLLLARPKVGDREARAEDRQLLLDALLAATDRLIVTYSGRDERTNRPRPPCAPVAELLDAVDATACAPGGGRARDVVLVEHPLQPFDERNFVDGVLRRPGPWSFDAVQLAGATAARAQRPKAPWLDALLPADPQPVVQVADLVGFVQHPVKAFLRQRLSLFLTDRDVDICDSLPLELDALQKWAIGDRLLEAALAGVPLERAAEAEERRGALPPRSIAGRALEEVGQDVEALLAAVQGLGADREPAGSRDIRVRLPQGRLIVGVVPNVRGSTITECVYSRLGPKHRLAAWVRFLTLTADQPQAPVRAITVGKGQRPAPVAVSRLEPVAASAEDRERWALAQLQALLDVYDLGMRFPLPLAGKTSAAWAEGRREQLDQSGMLERAQRQWESGQFPGEDAEPEHVYVFGRGFPLRSLMHAPPAPAETGLAWPAGEVTTFGGLARLLWDPLLHVEQDRA